MAAESMSFTISLKIIFTLLFFILLSNNLSAEDPSEVRIIRLKGYLDKEIIGEAKKELNQAVSDSSKTLLIEIDSLSGDLQEVLEIARKIYEAKILKKFKVVVYINGNAIGPSASIPFLADELIASAFVSWGGVTVDADSVLPLNILRSRVRSLVPAKKTNRSLLKLLAEGMVDPSMEIIEEKGEWKASEKLEGVNSILVSPKGETLVINHNQLKEQGLAHSFLSREEFLHFFSFSEKQIPHLEENAATFKTLSSNLSLEELNEKLKKHIKYKKEGTNVIGRIAIDNKKNGIDQSTWIYVKSALEYYKKKKPNFIILELNTPGGEVFSSQQISDALKDFDTHYEIPVVAFINNWAISAGAMLAYSCRFITIVKDASMGAAEPIIAGGDGGMITASEKVNSALRADFSNRAGFFDRNTLIAQAMVDKDIILVRRNGKIIKLKEEELIRLSGTNPDRLISSKGKLLTLDAKSMMDYGVADFMLMPEKLEMITKSEKETNKWPADKSLLFTHSFFQEIPNAVIDFYQMDWKVSFFAMLATPLVSSLLLMGMMIGFYLEMNTPGFGFPGIFALVCLSFIVLSSFSLQAVSWLELIILFVGLGLLSLEFFVLPGFGIAGVIGALFVLGGLLAMMLPSIKTIDFDFQTETFNAAGNVFIEKLAWLCAALILGTLSIAATARYVMPKFSLFSHLILVGEQNSSEGYVAAESHSLPRPGESGKVLAVLRPSGKILLNGNVYDAMSKGLFIEKDSDIVVTEVEGSKVFVEKRGAD